MVKLRGFDGLIFKPELYDEILSKNMEYIEDCQLIRSFNFQDFINKGILHPEKQQFIYLYEQEFLGFMTLGILAELSLNDYLSKNIKKHEKTLIREHLNEQTYARNHVGPVIVGHQHSKKIDKILYKLINEIQPFATWETIDGRKHKLWRVDRIQQIQNHFSEIESLYILDGHHRFQAASSYLLKVGENAKQKNKWIQGLVYSTKYIRCYPQFRKLIHEDYNIIVRNLMANKNLQIRQIPNYEPNNNDSDIVLLYNEKFYQIKHKQSKTVRTAKTGVEKLDQILKQAFDSMEKKNSNPIKFVPAILFNWSNISSEIYPIFLVKSPSIDTIFQIANKDQILPPKSTWLQPKPCLHMVIRLPF